MATKVLTVAGTRPEAIKLAPVVRALAADPGHFEPLFCATGQHRKMLDQVLATFGLKTDIELHVMRPNQPLAGLTAALLENLTIVLRNHRPDWVIVQGDTTTAMAATLAAFYQRIPIAHVEAGLRTGDRFQPFPEEVNRLIIDGIADRLFAPTPRAAANLRAERVPASRILVTGNTGIDALLHVSRQNIASPLDETLKRVRHRRLILVTTHRRENFGEPLMRICRAIRIAAVRNPDIAVLLPVHLNPNVHAVVRRELADVSNIMLTPPLAYIDFVKALKQAFVVLTDSGGVQEEAPSVGTPVLVLRHKTERPEAVESGAARLVGTGTDTIVRELERLLGDRACHQAMARVRNPFGDGRASERIVRAMSQTAAMAPERVVTVR